MTRTIFYGFLLDCGAPTALSIAWQMGVTLAQMSQWLEGLPEYRRIHHYGGI